jgi:putative salt-induced outer membrane protein
MDLEIIRKCILVFSFVPLLAWAQDKKLTNESELGIAAANGNTKTQTFQAKQTNEYKTGKDTFGLKSRYLNAKANGEETARYFMVGLRFERQLHDKLSAYTGEMLEKDRFANIDKRLATDLGAKYKYIDSENNKFFSELGYRYLHEDRINDSHAYSSLGRLYTEWERKWNENYSTRYWFEYMPNFTDPKDWLFNSEISLSAMLNETFSLKTGFLLRYDHFPAPGILYKTDTLFTTALVAKF